MIIYSFELIKSILFNAEYYEINRGDDTANPRRIFISGQKRGVFGVIKA
jgi:hypothetical protein